MSPLASLLVLAAAAATATTAAAADYKPCCMPDQWHGGYILSVETILSGGSGKPDRTEIEMDMVYDATTQRTATIVNTTDSKGNVQQVLQLGFYADKVEYTYNLKDKSCVKKDAGAFPARCLPGHSVLVEPSLALGMGDTEQKGRMWSYYISAPTMTIEARTVVTENGCIPIFGYELKTYPGPPKTYQLIVSYYKNLKPGLGSEDIFTVPDACM